MELKTFNKIGEKEIVYICDKLLKGTELVTLKKRFEYALNRYENAPEFESMVNKLSNEGNDIFNVWRKVSLFVNLEK